MRDGAGGFTPERIEALRRDIDLSDIPEITDFSKGWLRNAKTPARQTGKPDAKKTGKGAAGRT